MLKQQIHDVNSPRKMQAAVISQNANVQTVLLQYCSLIDSSSLNFFDSSNIGWYILYTQTQPLKGVERGQSSKKNNICFDVEENKNYLPYKCYTLYFYITCNKPSTKETVNNVLCRMRPWRVLVIFLITSSNPSCDSNKIFKNRK